LFSRKLIHLFESLVVMFKKLGQSLPQYLQLMFGGTRNFGVSIQDHLKESGSRFGNAKGQKQSEILHNLLIPQIEGPMQL